MRFRKYGIALGWGLLAILVFLSLFVGKYPLSPALLLAGDSLQWRVFLSLRVTRTVTAAIGGFALGISGFAFQSVFRNPLASPDMIGVSAGASAGAAAGILFFSSAAAITLSSFVGSLIAVAAAMAFAALDRSSRKNTIVLAGIAVHALAQTALMCKKLIADPERELASIEYWIMGSLSDIGAKPLWGNLLLSIGGVAVLLLLHRQLLLLAMDEGEAKMLGVGVGRLRLVTLLLATVTVSCIVSLTGLISFVSLLAPHGARLIRRDNSFGTMVLSGIAGGILLCVADILARSLAASELPVSIFTSALGAPALMWLVLRRRDSDALA